MPATARKEVPCEACGATLNLIATARRHCQTDECRLAYVVNWYLREESYDSDGHMSWSGPRGPKAKSGPGVAMAYAADYESGLNKRQYRVLDLAALVHQGRQPDTSRRWQNLCGDLSCVALNHWRLGGVNGGPKGNGPRIIARLDAAPLLRLVSRREARDAEAAMVAGAMGGNVTMMPRDRMISAAIWLARKNGYVTVSAADAICIDYLGVHPYEVFGDEFFDAA